MKFHEDVLKSMIKKWINKWINKWIQGLECLNPFKKGRFRYFTVRPRKHKTVEYRAPGCPRSSRSNLWKDHSIFYTFNASTRAETYQRSMFLTFKGQTTKTQKWPSTNPQGMPEALPRFFGKLILFSTNSVENDPGANPKQLPFLNILKPYPRITQSYNHIII